MSRNFNLDHTSIKKLLSVYDLKIPDFQRKFVWKKNKKESLINSIMKGFPVGAITLFDNDEGYLIIDGLQRINTLNQFVKSPSSIIKFADFYNQVEPKVIDFFDDCDLTYSARRNTERMIKKWYENLNTPFSYSKMGELVSLLNNHIRLSGVFDFEMIEELHNVLISEISIDDADIAMIIYTGDIEDLPELFRNINTGSVALSQYEILQAIWIGKNLDADLLDIYYQGYINELNIIRDDYEIESLKSEGDFDVFKNMLGLNNLICRVEEAGVIFPNWIKLNTPINMEEGIKFYNNDSISFEIFSTLITGSPNKVVKAVEDIFNFCEEPDSFILELNDIIMEVIYEAINIIKRDGFKLNNSRYHSIYVICGLIFSRYSIGLDDWDDLIISEEYLSEEIRDICLDIPKHNEEEWFINENRQIGFLRNKIKELNYLRE